MYQIIKAVSFKGLFNNFGTKVQPCGATIALLYKPHISFSFLTVINFFERIIKRNINDRTYQINKPVSFRGL